MFIVDKKSLEHLAELARIELKKEEEEKLLEDLGKILGYFEQLKEVNTEDVEPMTGGTMEQNVLRSDKEDIRNEINSSADELVKMFPEKEGRFLKVPPVFE